MADLKARPVHAGTRRTCPRCQFVLKVPSAEEAERLAALRKAAGEYAFWDVDGVALQDRQYVSLRCRLCATKIDATLDQVGQEITCPDCGTMAIVPPPAAAAEKPAAVAPRVDEEYAICEGLDQPDASHQLVYQKYLRLACKRCGTRMLATLDQVGREIVCPDCELPAIVPAPVEPAESPPDAAADEVRRHDEYVLAAGVDQPPAGVAYVKLQCPHCQTRLPATLDQVGTQVICPDCGTTVMVPAPKAPAPVLPAELDRAAEYGTGAAIVTPEYRHVEDYRYVEGYVGTRARSEKTGGEVKPPARRKAGDVVEEKPAAPQAAQSQPPHRPFVVGTVSLLVQDGVWQRWVGLSAAAMVIVLLLATGIDLVSRPAGPWADAWPWILGMALIATSGLLGIVWSAPAAAIWLAVVQETSEGADRIEQWPEAVFVDWMLGVLFLFNSLGLSTFAGVMLRGALREYAGVEFWPAAPLFILATFPILLLSMLESGSALNTVSWPVWRSIPLAWWAWLVFYLESALVAAAGGTLAAAAMKLAGPWGLALVTPLLLALALVYARLLGRLGWACQSLAARPNENASA